jgi:trigger factor
VNITVENLAPCKKLLRVEVDAAVVDAMFETITKDFQKQAALPGFRPGKAPRAMVLKKYEADIKAEAKRKLIGESYRQALEEKHIEAITQPDIEELQFDHGQALLFTATVETAPEFELPEYKGLPVRRELKVVTEGDVDRALELLAKQQLKFETVARALRPGDVAVVNYTGTVDGKPVSDVAPAAPGLTEKKGFWVDMAPDSFIAGFADQLAGAQAGEQRTVTVTFPADFSTKELAGRQGVYAVEVVEVKEKHPAAIDDALAKIYGAADLGVLRAGVRRDLENELNYTRQKAERGQLIGGLLNRVNFELPEAVVAQETRHVVYNIVQENTKRGVGRDLIEQQKEEIYSAAARSAKDRVKLSFLIRRIAAKEDLKVSQEEALHRVQSLASAYQIPVEKFIKDLQKRDAVGEIYEQIAHEKVIRFLEQNAHYVDVPAA